MKLSLGKVLTIKCIFNDNDTSVDLGIGCLSVYRSNLDIQPEHSQISNLDYKALDIDIYLFKKILTISYSIPFLK